MKIELLNLLKNDKEIRKYISNMANEIFEKIESNQEYEKIRMTKEEFISLKSQYSDNILEKFDNYINYEIDNVNVALGDVKASDKDLFINYTYNLSKSGDLIKVENDNFYSAVIGQKIYAKNLIELKNVNSVASKDVVPNVGVRINLAEKSRYELFEVVEIITNQYKALYQKFITNLLKINLSNMF